MRTLYDGLRRVAQTLINPETRRLYDLADRSPQTPRPDATRERYRFVENVDPAALRESLARNAEPRESLRKTLNVYLAARFDYRFALAAFVAFCLFLFYVLFDSFYIDLLRDYAYPASPSPNWGKIDFSNTERWFQQPWYYHAVALPALATVGLSATAAALEFLSALSVPLIKPE